MNTNTTPTLPMVSVLLPSLWRFDQLIKAIRSFSETATDPKSVQMLVRIHDGDEIAVSRASEIHDLLPLFHENSLVVLGPFKPNGYGNEWLWNDLLPLAIGRWLQFWSDDMTIEGKGWDSQLALIQEENVVVHPEFHRLGHSVYFEDKGGPVPFIRSHVLGTLLGVPDVVIPEELVKRRGFQIKFLRGGITVNHQRNEQDDTISKTPYAP